jgi:dCTP deaminase
VVLTAKKLVQEIRKGNGSDPNGIAVVPEPDLIAIEESGEASVNLRLGRWFLTMRQSNETAISPTHEGNSKIGRLSKQHYVPFGQEFVLHPNRFVLASTLEWIRLPALYAIANVGEIPVKLVSGMMIGQLFVHRVDGPPGQTHTPLAGQRKPRLGEMREDGILEKLKKTKF